MGSNSNNIEMDEALDQVTPMEQVHRASTTSTTQRPGRARSSVSGRSFGSNSSRRKASASAPSLVAKVMSGEADEEFMTMEEQAAAAVAVVEAEELATFSPSTRGVLLDFGQMVRRSGHRQDVLDKTRQKWAVQKDEYDAKKGLLKKVSRAEGKLDDRTIFDSLKSKSKMGLGTPTPKQIEDLAIHHFPYRSNIKVFVTDFGPGRAEPYETMLEGIEQFWDDKPDWVTVRWIHVPIGQGLLHSTLQDQFIHGGQCGRPFKHGGSPSWPYVKVNQLILRSQEHFANQYETLRVLSHQKGWEALSDKNLDDLPESTRKDLEWRAGHLRTSLDFWNLARADLPQQLAENLCVGQQGPLNGISKNKEANEQQVLSKQEHFKKAQLLKGTLRAYHRQDGFILTFAPPGGIDYLDGDLVEYLGYPPEYYQDNDNTSAVAHVREAFLESGTDKWHRKTLEWFEIYLLTEIGVVPHNIRQGRSAPSLMSAYQDVAQDLRRRRKEPWRKDETISLVRDYLSCIDELTAISTLTNENVRTFKGLLKDAERFEEEDVAEGLEINEEGETTADRIRWAIALLEERDNDASKLLEHAKTSLNEVFQLRSIEQNERAIITDGQNKAVFIFAAVTIIFLPLSFCTSYFGMNLKGVVDTDKTETFFWELCGSLGLGIVLLVTLFALRDTIAEKMMRLSRGRW